MSRIIEFRGLTSASQEWVYGDYYQGVINSVICHIEDVSPTWNEPGGDSRLIIHACNSETIGQFTGLHDKNGVKIFEGDIVQCTMKCDGFTLPHVGEIIYMESFGAFATKNHAGETLLHNHLLNTFFVIGNIHQNPEILEKNQ